MHEFSVAADMLRIIEEAMGGRKAIAKVTATIGPLSGICAESLTFCFSEVARQEGFGEPELILNIVEARAQCSNCDTEYGLTDFTVLCPNCQSLARTILSGGEFMLDSVEVAEDDDE